MVLHQGTERPHHRRFRPRWPGVHLEAAAALDAPVAKLMLRPSTCDHPWVLLGCITWLGSGWEDESTTVRGTCWGWVGGCWWFGILGIPLSSNPFHKGIPGIETSNPNHQLTISWLKETEENDQKNKKPHTLPEEKQTKAHPISKLVTPAILFQPERRTALHCKNPASSAVLRNRNLAATCQ